MIKLNKKIIDELIKVNKDLIIPNYFVKYLSKLEITSTELIVLLYFLNNKESLSFNLEKISKDLYMDENIILDTINNLIEKDYISIEMNNDNGVISEFISLDLFYSKISSFIQENNESINSTDIYSQFESEFGRTLSPIEYETINKWIESNISEDLIKKALKEAVLNGVNSIRYIDKILFEWSKKGYKNTSDIDNKKEKDNYVEEIYDYDWLNE